jgi:light-regulated signal transduction histidine kinase (bacteriophytochrome)
VTISARRGEGEWVLSVADRGIGIAPEHFERVFQVFQRLHGRDRYAGTGIGLAICKRIVERHGGRIWIESEEGRGATFLFSVPDREAEGAAAGPAAGGDGAATPAAPAA